MKLPSKTKFFTTLSLAGLLVAGCSQNTASTLPEKVKDGTYTALGDYQSPAGSEEIQVSLTFANSLITDATVTGNATNPISQKKQADFIAGFKEQVIGKPLNTLSLQAVSGASLTTKGFMDAVAKIGAEARA